MFNLKENIENWRNRLEQKEVFQNADLDELESHLVEEMEVLADSALTQEERFLIATRRLGDTETLANEFAKVNRKAIVLHRLIWMAGGVLLFDMLSRMSSALASLASYFVTYININGHFLGVSVLVVKSVCFIAGFAVVYRIYKTGMPSRTVKYYTDTWKRKILFMVSIVIFYILLIISPSLLQAYIIHRIGIEEISKMFLITNVSYILGTILLFIFLLIFVISKVGKTQKA